MRTLGMLWIALWLAASAAAQTPPSVEDKSCDVKVRLRGPLYDLENAALQPGLGETLDVLAKTFLERCVGKLLIIEVHSVEMPTPELNQRLSELRALLVRGELAKRGIPESRTMPVAMGASKPMVPPNDPDALGHNRRVTFRIVE